MKKYTFSVPRKWKRLLVKYKKADLINAKMRGRGLEEKGGSSGRGKDRETDRQTDRQTETGVCTFVGNENHDRKGKSNMK